MSVSLSPSITSVGENYSFGIAETFSYIPVENSERPLFAKAVYHVKGSKGVTLGTLNITYDGNWSSIVCINTTTFSILDAANSDGTLTSIPYPAGTQIEAPISSFRVSVGGPVLAQKA